jgi:DNA-directed RNA polymerase subunit K/omega
LARGKGTLVTREDVLTRSGSEYEALVAIAKEARRLNAVPGLHLKENEKAIPKAVENFVTGRVDYEVEGERDAAVCVPPGATGRKKPRRRLAVPAGDGKEERASK